MLNVEKLTKELNSNILERLLNVGADGEVDPLSYIVALDAEVTRLETTIELIRLLIQRISQLNDLEILDGVIKQKTQSEVVSDPSKQVRIRCLSDFY